MRSDCGSPKASKYSSSSDSSPSVLDASKNSSSCSTGAGGNMGGNGCMGGKGCIGGSGSIFGSGSILGSGCIFGSGGIGGNKGSGPICDAGLDRRGESGGEGGGDSLPSDSDASMIGGKAQRPE